MKTVFDSEEPLIVRLFLSGLLAVAVALSIGWSDVVRAAGSTPVLTGQSAFGDWHHDKPGVRRLIRPADMPRPFASPAADNIVSEDDPPADALPKVPIGFSVTRFASGLQRPRLIRVAPNGDIFAAEMGAGQIRVLRAADGATKAARNEIFATGLTRPFGIAFFPPGPNPQWVYVANTNSVVRFPYVSGDLKARAPSQTVVAQLSPVGDGHNTRDVQFSLDGTTMFVSVGSFTNVAENMPRKTPRELRRWQADHGLGAAWGDDTERADVLAFDPDGGHRSVFATGIRNCVGLAVHPKTGDLWCSVNERDLLGDDLPPDYVTRVGKGRFYGWPWFYIGRNEDPRRKGERPDLARRVTVPDVLVQPHSAPIEMTFYPAVAARSAPLPPEYSGDAFVALHGSWNRAKRTGYKVVRVRLRDGVPTGEYEDFMTGFVLDDHRVWGRPTGITIAHDGAILVSQDDNGIVWRVAYEGKRAAKP